MRALRVVAPAKVNLFLRVLGRRPDGFHEIETAVLPISLADRLEVIAEAGPDLELSLELSGTAELVDGVPGDRTNLVVRAAAALAERSGVRGSAAIRLEKRVPSAAGLGGGSADAAATLRSLNDLWSCGLDDDALREVAATVGSDVPALLGPGPWLARGRGERVEPIHARPLQWCLVTAAFGVRTEMGSRRGRIPRTRSPQPSRKMCTRSGDCCPTTSRSPWRAGIPRCAPRAMRSSPRVPWPP